jgi:hypothetical protein
MAALALAAFADLIRAAQVDFTLEWNQQASRAADGEAHHASRGAPLFRAKITSPAMPIAEALGLMALVNSLQGSAGTFLLYDKRMPYPSSDPTGSTFGAATPVAGTITSNVSVAFTGFPNGYVIPLGTYFQIIYDTSRYYVGQFAAAKTADGSGAVSASAVTPPLPDDVDPGDAVTVLKPSGKFRLDPGSAILDHVQIGLASLVFSARQTYEQ